MQENNSVAVVGMGCLFPKSNGLNEYWQLLFNGTDAITEIPENTHFPINEYYDENPLTPDHIYCRRGGFIPAVTFDPSKYGIPPNNLEATDTSQLLGLVVAEMALRDAGYNLKKPSFNKERTSIILGVTGTQELVIPLGARLESPVWKNALKTAKIPDDKTNEVIERIKQAYPGWQENSFPGLLGNVVAGRIANKFDFGGTNSVIDAACASSLSAVNVSVMELLSGKCDLSVTGGVDTLNDVFMHMCFAKTGVLSSNSDAKPFSRYADGTVLGEGVGMIVLKRLTDAKKDGDRIYAVIKGIGSSSDGKTGGIYTPDEKGQRRALEAAYKDACVDPSSIKIIEAHGTGTRIGDKIEFRALKTFFEDSAGDKQLKNKCALGSVKSMIGHTKAAAGIAGLIKSILSLYHKVYLPTLKAETPDPELDIENSPFYLNTHTKPWINSGSEKTPRRSGISAFGFGGSNFHAVLEEYNPVKNHVSWNGTVQIAAFSASDKNSLKEKLINFQCLIKKKENLDSREKREKLSRESARSREQFSCHDKERLILVIHSDDNPLDIIKNALDRIENSDLNTARDNRLYYGNNYKKGKIGFLFPGQGSQYIHMGRDIFSIFPEACDTLERASARFSAEHESNKTNPLHDYIFPPPAHIQKQAISESQLRETSVAQPAIGSFSIALSKVLKRYGIHPDITCGHSFGELTAMAVAGWINEESFLSLAVARGRYMSEACHHSHNNGGMLAVKGEIETVEYLLEKNNLDLVVANKNAYSQYVVSGNSEEISKAFTICRNAGLQAVKLPVSAAFHTQIVKNAVRPFSESIEQTDINPTDTDVMSNTTGTFYPKNTRRIKTILGKQLINPVNFIKNIKTMFESGVSTFIEVGPKTALTGLTRSILKGKNISAVSLDQSSGTKNGMKDLACVLADLASKGYDVDLKKWEVSPERLERKKMCVHLSGANPKTSKDSSPPQTDEAAIEIKCKPHVPFEESTQFIGSEKMSQLNENTNARAYEAMKMVEKGLKAMQDLQAQTARAHEKFLETQAEASRVLQGMMNSTSALANDIAHSSAPSDGKTSDQLQESSESVTASDHSDSYSEPDIQNKNQAYTREGETVKKISATGDRPVAEKETNTLNTLFETVSTLTGYPQEMLERDMDLETDLGIDSIKRVEILSEVEKKFPDIGSISPDEIAEVKTIEGISSYIDDRYLKKEFTANKPSDVPPTVSKEEKIQQRPARQTIENPFDKENIASPDPNKALKKKLPRKSVCLQQYPIDEIRFHNGAKIEIAGNKKVYITQDSLHVSKSFLNSFLKEGINAETVDISGDTIPELPDAAGIVIVPDNLGRLSFEPAQRFLKKAFQLVRKNGKTLIRSASENSAFLATISFLGGGFGFDEKEITYPLQGGLSGLAKTAALEWKGVLCKCIDMYPSYEQIVKMSETAVALMMTQGSVETGIDGEVCNIPSLADQKIRTQKPVEISREDVFVITGGAKGVTAECAIQIAEEFSPRIALIGRSEIVYEEPGWLKNLKEESEIKQALLENQFTSQKPTPIELNHRYQKIASNRKIKKTLEILKNRGAEVMYFSCDIKEKNKTDEIFQSIRKAFGKITAVIHGAGILEDKLILEKSDEKFNTVFDTKVSGLQSLIHATCDDTLKYFICFSSIAARTGNVGQADYAMANEALNKSMQKMARERKNCRCLAINWGPWDGGMVTRTLKNKFLQQGVDLIHPDSGAKQLIEEIRSADDAVEIVIGHDHFDNKKAAMPSLSKALQYTIGKNSAPVLDSHIIADKRVVPFSLLMEWQAYASEKNNPGLLFTGMDRIRLLKGIRLDNDDTVNIEVKTGKCKQSENGYTVETSLYSDKINDKISIHSSGVSILNETLPPPPVFSSGFSQNFTSCSVTVEQAYRDVLFHGNDLRAITSIKGYSSKGIEVISVRTPSAEKWLKPPHSKQWTTDPLLFDAAFQAAILWTYERRKQICLPSYIANLRLYTSFASTAGESIRIIFTVNEESEHKIKGYFTFLDNNIVIASITGFEAIMDPAISQKIKADTVLVPKKQILAFAEGNPSEAFGKKYQIFDSEREMARLPRPPYFFMDRITKIEHPQWKMVPGGWIESEFDIPSNGWYFIANGSKRIPFCILLEIALQPCGWLAAWAGSALNSDKRLYFRNLGGDAQLLESVSRNTGTVRVRSRLKNVSRGGGMILQDFDIEIKKHDTFIYKGETSFGFFTGESLSNQVGIKNSRIFQYTPSDEECDETNRVQFEDDPPLTPFDTDIVKDNTVMPSKALRMIDSIDHFSLTGGLYKKGYVKATKKVNPEEWFFKAHFYQDPVCPGSLGIESFIQMLRFYAFKKWHHKKGNEITVAENTRHLWTYRGQITPLNKTVEIFAHIKEISFQKHPAIRADGALAVDGICIYEMNDFSIKLIGEKETQKSILSKQNHEPV